MTDNSSRNSDDAVTDGGRAADDVATDGGRAANDAATDGDRAANDAATDGGRAANDAATDGGVATGAAQKHSDTDYLGAEVNILNPSTPYMRDHLRIVWSGFAIWVLAVWGPVTLTRLAPGAMTSQMPILGFPIHYFLVAFGAPTSALILAFWYSRKRDALDEKYGIEHGTADVAADGGTDE